MPHEDIIFSVIIQYDNARPHIALMTKNAIIILSQPLYTLDLDPKDYHTFWSFSNNFRGVSLNNDVEFKT